MDQLVGSVLTPTAQDRVFSVRGRSDRTGEVEEGFTEEAAFERCS